MSVFPVRFFFLCLTYVDLYSDGKAASVLASDFVVAAILHHLEGYHVHTLDIGSLLGLGRVCNV